MFAKNPIKDQKPTNIDINKQPENYPVDREHQDNNKKRVKEDEWQPMDSEFPGSSKTHIN